MALYVNHEDGLYRKGELVRVWLGKQHKQVDRLRREAIRDAAVK